MDLFNINKNNDLGSEHQEGDIFMELDDETSDARDGGVEFVTETRIIDPNLVHEYIRNQPSTSGNNERKRKSQSTYPFAKKVSRSFWKVEQKPLDMPVHESELIKTNAEASSFINIVTVPDAKNMLNERTIFKYPEKHQDMSVPGSELLKTSVGASSVNNSVTVPDAEYIPDDHAVIKCPENPHDNSEILLFSDSKDSLKAGISSADTAFEEVKMLREEQKQSIAKQRHSCYYIDCSKRGIIKCDKCGKSFAQLKLFMQHRKKFYS